MQVGQSWAETDRDRVPSKAPRPPCRPKSA